MSRDKLAQLLGARLVPGAGARGPLVSALAEGGAQDAPRRAVRAAAGRQAQASGKVAEAWVAGLCDELQRSGRLWWVQIPDPFQVVRTQADGKKLVVPTARAHATDCVGGLATPGGALLLAWEVKSCPHDAPSWSYSELRPSQVESLESAAQLGATACVLLVGLELGLVARALYVLPWTPGQGLPFADERASFHLVDPRAQAFRLTPARAAGWVDHPQLAHQLRK